MRKALSLYLLGLFLSSSFLYALNLNEAINYKDKWNEPASHYEVRLEGKKYQVYVSGDRINIAGRGEDVFDGAAKIELGEIREVLFANTDEDSCDELLVVYIEKGCTAGGLALYDWIDDRYELVSAFRGKDYLPFMLRGGDIDNDGQLEVMVGLFNRAMSDESRYAKKFHIFNVQDNRLTPQWFTEREYIDFRVVNIKGENQLLEIRNEGGVYRSNLFSWDKFGLWLDETVFISRIPFHFDCEYSDKVIIENAKGKRVEVYNRNSLVSTRLFRGKNER